MIGSIIVLLMRFRGGWRQTIGLPLGFVSVLTMTNIGTLLYLLPWYDPSKDPYLKQTGVTIEVVAQGGWMTAIGFLGFLVGTFLIRRQPVYGNTASFNPPGYALSNRIITFGTIFLIVSPLFRVIPSATPLSESAKLFLLCGICMGFITASREKNQQTQAIYLLIAFMIPVVTVTIFGFLASGAAMLALMLSCFINRRFPEDRKRIVLALPFVPLLLWVGMSVFVTYMDSRVEIRKVVWEQSTVNEKFNRVTTSFSNFQWFDIGKTRHLHTIDIRLNQNVLVGRAVEQHESFQIPFEDGKTILYSLVAWVPRVIWPGKPSAGGSDFVTLHTGRKFAGGTSVAVGHVFEFYVNFGILGVFVGFVAIGMFIRWLDLQATTYLLNGDNPKFIQYHVLGLVAIQPSALLFFWVTSMVGAFIITKLLARWLVTQGTKI